MYIIAASISFLIRNLQVSMNITLCFSMAKTRLILAIAVILLSMSSESVSGLPSNGAAVPLLTDKVAPSASRRMTGGKGQWQTLVNNVGVVAMHMVLTYQNTVVLFDSTERAERSGYRLKHGYHGRKCNFSSHVVDASCFAHSVEYKISRNKIRPLLLEKETFYSSGSILNNGTIIQVGGSDDGTRIVHEFEPCDDGKCNWKETRKHLTYSRSYSSSLSLPRNDRIVVVGGSRAFSFEFIPKLASNHKSFDLPFLSRSYATHANASNDYPFLHLSSDGNLFIFTHRDSILFDYKSHSVVKHFPQMPGEGSRTFPSSGSSVILPLDHSDGFKKVEVMICGGAAASAIEGDTCRHSTGLRSCGRMVITGAHNKWTMENMPGPRLMNDMLLLPTGDVLLINGAHSGCAGLYDNPALPSREPYLYNQQNGVGRFSVLKSTKIARMYQSSAVVVPDGRVLVAGGNQHAGYVFHKVAYPTELRLQAFHPPYLDAQFSPIRPQNVSIYSNGKNAVEYDQGFSVQFELAGKLDDVEFTVYSPPFTTHSVSMSQRLLKLECQRMVRSENGVVNALLQSPPSATVAPAGYYMLSVVNRGIPSVSQWIRFMHQA